MFDLIAFDADDTLWHNELLYARTEEKFARLLSPYLGAEQARQALFATEMRNLDSYGYGIKSFTLSMIETAIQLGQGGIGGEELLQIIGWAREMLQAEVELLPYARETVTLLAQGYPLMLITKGDLLDQQRKVERSGLEPYFTYVQVVSQKDGPVYLRLLGKLGIAPERFMMVGNSLRSDILPVVEIGGTAVYVPHELTWTHERVKTPGYENHYHELEHLGQLPALIDKLALPGNP